ncbi:hypothetical protein BofuT4_uP086670.1 [Botrytis cinerea T4]|uniref:Uncharacterized protein n=1 Tax=Botryotinia fuckeliana (strain T4) TaxID=999810 RepID=G2YGJ0_BOTF4|nr:hypothetical protein BofuT4_uP086670.1 [Botrytis cinerea T4]
MPTYATLIALSLYLSSHRPWGLSAAAYSLVIYLLTKIGSAFGILVLGSWFLLLASCFLLPDSRSDSRIHNPEATEQFLVLWPSTWLCYI